MFERAGLHPGRPLEGLRNEGRVVGSGAAPLLVAGGLSMLGKVAFAAGLGEGAITFVTLENPVRQKVWSAGQQ